jgi:vancomycin permeability regulator SanA
MSALNHSIRRRLLRAAAAFAAIFLLGAALIAFTGIHDDIAHADIALVPGSKVEAGGDPSPRLRARLDKAVELYRAGWFPEIIASGGIGKEGYDEAAVMKTYLVSHGIPEERVFADNNGVTTFASARKTREILREKKLSSVMVISQYFHIPRAKLALKRCGIVTVRGAHANFFEPRDIYSLLREVPGCIEYWFRRAD